MSGRVLLGAKFGLAVDWTRCRLANQLGQHLLPPLCETANSKLLDKTAIQFCRGGGACRKFMAQFEFIKYSAH